ncbi:DUF4192 domain-containing protein [Dietzia cinnamea]|uniref:DUF4192 domain-containing protein n=1 Tax=Dietzia cinnamea TaxID=321318 RepID=UPI0021A39044|nr:DUF4192 domain-containing protein [Dietzia cinnamea]MCT1884055.1 DUF4192 domain-containing protein [Dietzia cinnamea]
MHDTRGPRHDGAWTRETNGRRAMTTGELKDEGGTDGRATVVITSPEELIASIPAMLGFPPGPGSVVILCGRTADGGQGPVVRMDVDGLLDDGRGFPGADDLLDDPDDPDDLADLDDPLVEDPLDGLPGDAGDPGDAAIGRARPAIDPGPARGLARFCAREGIDSVHLVVVHEDCADGYLAGLRAEDAASAFEYWLGEAGTGVEAAYGVGEFAEGEPWVDLFGMTRGVQIDPDTTQIAAVHAYDGRVRAGSRDEIDRLYLVRDPDACDEDRPDDAVVGGAGEVDAADPGGGSAGGRDRRAERARAVAAAVERHDDAARRLGVGEEVDDDELAAIGRDLLVIAVRDEIYRRLAQRGLGDRDGRRLVWWAVARRRPARERSVALLLLGAASYFAGSGVHAWSALSAAVDADPGNNLARLLLQGLHHGMAPERLRRVAATA